jgi:endonuclease III
MPTLVVFADGEEVFPDVLEEEASPRLRFRNPTLPLNEQKRNNNNKVAPKKKAAPPKKNSTPKKKATTTITSKKGETTKSTTTTTSKQTPSLLPSTPSLLPTDGEFETWKNFGDSGGYNISKPQWIRVCSWVVQRRSKPDVIADNVAFHRLIVSMKQETNLATPRDAWANVLPPPNSPNFFWATLMLMICTPLVPDTKIIEVFQDLFRENHVTEEWVLQFGEKNLAEKLATLGMQKKSSSNIMNAAKHMISLSREPRDYRELQLLDGVGPKIALVTIQEAHGKAQGIPCDVHMCRIFKLLNWIPSFVEKESGSCLDILENVKTGEDKYNYELARAAMEGWFPPSYWRELNQTWAGLGQLLNDQHSRIVMANYIDIAASSFDSPWRVADKANFIHILCQYLGKK